MATYYVAPAASGGSDSNNGLSVGSPFLTLAHSFAAMSGSDTLNVVSGTYGEGSFINSIPSGSSGNPTLIQSYAGNGSNRPIIQPPANASRFIYLGNRTYITFLNLEIDGSLITGTGADGIKCSSTGGSSATNIVIQGCYVHHFPQNGILISPGPPEPSAITVTGSEIAWNGSPDAHLSFGHGIYCEESDCIFTNNHTHDNGEYGIHIYSSSAVPGDTTYVSRNLVSGNRSHDNGRGLHSGGGASDGAGVTIWFGTGNKCFNNLFYGNAGAGIQLDSGADQTLLLNNTCYNNGGAGGFAGLDLGGDGVVTNTTVKDNISYSNSGLGDYHNNSTGTVASNNLSGDGTAIGSSSLTNTNPQFVNAVGNDFHIQSTSPAKNAGVSTSPTVTTDYDGVSRPQGSAYCIGAYEYVTPAAGLVDAGLSGRGVFSHL